MTLPDTDERPDYQFVYREHAQALYAALVEDAFYITMEQKLGEQRSAREAMLRYLDYSMVEASDYGKLYFPETHRHGVAVWSQPLAPEREAQRKRANLNLCAARWARRVPPGTRTSPTSCRVNRLPSSMRQPGIYRSSEYCRPGKIAVWGAR
jgi:hypothetical protein